MAITEAVLGTPTTWLRAERSRRPGAIPTHGVGANLLRIVREQPGIHFRALGRQAGLTSSGQLRHHLDRLADLTAIVEVKDGRFSRFFAGGEEDPRLRARQARLSRPVPNLIARLLADRPMSRTELRRRLGCADSTLGYHLNRLVQVGDIQRRIGPNGHEYALADSGIIPPDLPWRRPPTEAAPSTRAHAPNNGVVFPAAPLPALPSAPQPVASAVPALPTAPLAPSAPLSAPLTLPALESLQPSAPANPGPTDPRPPVADPAAAPAGTAPIDGSVLEKP